MPQEISNISAVLLLYIFIFFKYLFYAVSYFNIQFIMATIMISLLSWINITHDSIPEESKQTAKFIGHTMFISVCFSLLNEMLLFVYSKIFYYGFANTIILFYMGSLIAMSKLATIFKDKITFYFSKSHLGNFILISLNYYYNTYIIAKKYNQKIIKLFKYYFNNYVWTYVGIIAKKFLKINVELSDNQEFNIVKKKFNQQCSNIKQIVIERAVQPYFIKTLQESLLRDPFDQTQNNATHLNLTSYKNSLNNNNIDMSFLSNTNLEDNNDDLDDLDDVDLSDVPDAPANQELDEDNEQEQTVPQKNVSKNPAKGSNKKIAPEKMTRQERRAMLRKKIKNKQMERGGNKNAKQTMKAPGMQKMMETMLKGDNLEKIMKDFPMPNQGTGQSLDANKMKKIIQSLGNK